MRVSILLPCMFALSTPIYAQALRQFDIPTLERLGQAMFDQDIRAARATDILHEKGVILSQNIMKGWIVISAGERQTVRFIGEKDGVVCSFIDVEFDGTKDGILRAHDPIPLKAEELGQAKARLLVAADLQTIQNQLCASSYNLIALPDPDGAGFLVWAIAANMNPDEVQVGGHFRYTVSANGEKIEKRDRLFKSCLVLSKKPKDLPPGATLSAFSMGWIVSDTPLEIHVFLQKYAKLPFFIVTTNNNKRWEVADGRIKALN